MGQNEYIRRNKVNEMTKEKFEKPDAEVVEFSAEDVIVTSGACREDCIKVCQDDCLIKN